MADVGQLLHKSAISAADLLLGAATCTLVASLAALFRFKLHLLTACGFSTPTSRKHPHATAPASFCAAPTPGLSPRGYG